MVDVRPVEYVIGLTVMTPGLAMVLPMVVDMAEGAGHGPVFAHSVILTIPCGGLVALAIIGRGIGGAIGPHGRSISPSPQSSPLSFRRA